MASLTPGILSKLVENAGNERVRVTGEHRSALLQVIEIVPSLSPSDHADPWHSKGFFLKLSDSLHSAYVSIAPDDLDLVYSDKIQLGQFVYVSRFDSGSPVPVLRGLKPVPRRRACVGSPKDLVSSHLLPITSASLDEKKIEKKKNGGLVKSMVEKRRLSLDSARRIWDDTCTFKPSSTTVHFQKKSLPPSSVSPLKSKNDLSSTRPFPKPVKKVAGANSDFAPATRLVKVPLKFETCSDQRVSWSALPPTLRNTGKETIRHKNAAILAAAQALEEASASESVIRCMQAFADLCKFSKKISLGSLVEQYLDLHHDMLRAATVVKSLLHPTPPETKSTGAKSRRFSDSMIKETDGRDAVLWVHAAVETNLSKFSLFKTPENKTIGKYHHHVILENSPQKIYSENKSPAKEVPLISSQRRVTTTKIKPRTADHATGNGLKDAADLAEELLMVSRQWFMEYMDHFLSRKVELRGTGHEAAEVLRQLKRVDQWLNDVLRNEVKVDRSVEKLRKKLCGFFLEQVSSAMLDGK